MQKEEDQMAPVPQGPLHWKFMILSRHDSVYSDPKLRLKYSARNPSSDHHFVK
jgi:hypothetical protein